MSIKISTKNCISNSKTREFENAFESIYGTSFATARTQPTKRSPGYFTPYFGQRGPEIVMLDGRSAINLSSYDYLSLISHPAINEAAIKSIKEYGTSTGGVRATVGTTQVHRQLEERLAEWYGQESAIVYASGFQTNNSVLETLASSEDLIIFDMFVHKSIHEGNQASKAKLRPFRHNDATHVSNLLEFYGLHYPNRFVVMDSVYSMQGDAADLPNILPVAENNRAITYVDEAHSLGVLGRTGHGILEHFKDKGIVVKPDIIMGTLSKTIPSLGGFIAGSKDLTRYLFRWSSGSLFSASLPPHNAAAALAALEVIEQEPERVEQLRGNIAYFANGLEALGLDSPRNPQSAILPVVIGPADKAMNFANFCQEHNVVVHAFTHNIVPRNHSIVRCCVMAGHTKRNLDYVLETFEKAKKRILD